MAETKTKPTTASVKEFLDEKAEGQARKDCDTIAALMEKVTGEKPVMWGPSIVGFGKYHYQYDSGHQGEMCITGFSPRAANLTLYVIAGSDGQADLLARLGKHKSSKGCLYIKKLADIDISILEELIRNSVSHIRTKFPD
ncbi:MAG TPA: DUF1801 domain-containing protein [Mucilaginibacter sp.]|nr:DUF1801 domain-containing protein [Mucilaginibacter sp.]